MRRADTLVVAVELLRSAADRLERAGPLAGSRVAVDCQNLDEAVGQASDKLDRAHRLLYQTFGAATLPPRKGHR